MPFEIHPQLLADCHVLGRVGSCHILLNGHAAVPWMIVVPETKTTDYLDLPAAERETVGEICAAVARFIKSHWQLEKTNFAGLGNVVPQLHLHVIGRKPTDPCWPGPIWGFLPAKTPYTEQEVTDIVAGLQTDLPGFQTD
ncbi:MAG: HIT family protein [Planctomycetaceae bacterium]|nr:HIT family protein [Planctomycetaceae bacterium]